MKIELSIEHCKEEIIKSIVEISNKYNISYYFLEMIVYQLYEEINQNKRAQIEKMLIEEKKERNKIKEGEENE